MIFLLLLLRLSGVKAVINPYGPTIVNDFTNCIVGLMEIDFNKSGLLIFANSDNVSTSVARIRTELLKYIHRNIKYSVQIASPSKEIAICGRDDKNTNILKNIDLYQPIPLADYFIIIIDKYEDFTYLASKLIRSRSWNPFAKFIVLLFHYVSNDKANVENIENIMTCLYKYNVINIVVIVPQAKNIRNAFIYGWRPYDPPNHCGYTNETARNRLRIENICSKGYLKNKLSAFKGRIPSNMKGCTLYVLALEKQPFVSRDRKDPNIEKFLISQMSQTFDFQIEFEILNNTFRGERDTGEWDGALRELISKRGDILLGGIFSDFDVHEDFECSTTYLADAYTWVVPRANPSPRWVPLIIIFQEMVWLSVIIIFIICAIAWRILGKLSNDSFYSQSFGHCFIGTWICTLGFCTYSRPSTGSLRLFFVFLNIYCILCITAYQTKLIDVLRNPTFEYQIKTAKELTRSGIKFGGFEELHDLFYNSSDPFDYYIGEHWTDIENISKAMIDVAVHRNFSLLCSRLELAHISAVIPELSNSFGNFKYYVFDSNVFTVPIEMIALKGFPLMRHFSQTIDILNQSGMGAALRKYFNSFNMRRRARLLRSMNVRRPDIDALSLQHLQGGFLALILGYVLGSFALIVENIANSNFIKKNVKDKLFRKLRRI